MLVSNQCIFISLLIIKFMTSIMVSLRLAFFTKNQARYAYKRYAYKKIHEKRLLETSVMT